MKSNGKLLALLLAMTLVFSLFAACGNSSAPPDDASETAPAAENTPPDGPPPADEPPADEAPADEEPVETAPKAGAHKTIAEVAPDIPMELPLTTEDVTFEYFTTLNPQILGYMSSLSENLYYKTAAELTGVTIDFILASPDTQTENFYMMVASDEYTDLIGSEGSKYTGGVELAVEDNVFVNILDYAEYAPHYFALLDSGEYDKSIVLTDSGYMAGFGIIYTEEQPLNQGYMIRQDWLEEQNLDSPTTYDQWYDVLCNFRDSYDCIPLALTGFNLSGLSGGFGVYGDVSPMSVPVYVDDDTVKFAWTENSFKDYLQLMNDWYEEGLIDPDELLNSAPFPDESEITSDKRGIWKVERDNMIYYTNMAANPDFHVVAIPYPTMNEGETSHFKELTPNIASPALFLTTDCEDIPLLVSWVDFRYSKEGATLANYGTEGYTFEYDEDGVPAFTDVIIHNEEGMTSSLAMNVFTLWRCECLYDAYRMNSTFTEDQRNAPDIWATNSDDKCTLPSVSLSAQEGEEAASLYSDIYTYASEHIIKFINGDEDLSTYDTFVDTINSMKADKLTAIYQAAYDRYISR